MKAKIIKTGEIVEVVDRTDRQVTVYRNDETEPLMQNVYNRDEVELDFNNELAEVVTIDGWIVRDKYKADHAISDLYFSMTLPKRNPSCCDWYNMRPTWLCRRNSIRMSHGSLNLKSKNHNNTSI